MKIFILLLLLLSSCAHTDSPSTETDKIEIFFGEEWNSEEYVVEDVNHFTVFIQMDIDKITRVEFNDVSSSDLICTDDITKSPSMIAAYDVDPELNIEQLVMRIKLPCAAYHGQWFVSVDVESLSGRYHIKRNLPVMISRESPGYFREGYEYSGRLPQN